MYRCRPRTESAIDVMLVVKKYIPSLPGCWSGQKQFQETFFTFEVVNPF